MATQRVDAWAPTRVQPQLAPRFSLKQRITSILAPQCLLRWFHAQLFDPFWRHTEKTANHTMNNDSGDADPTRDRIMFASFSHLRLKRIIPSFKISRLLYTVP